jgi:hypothetical protein
VANLAGSSKEGYEKKIAVSSMMIMMMMSLCNREKRYSSWNSIKVVTNYRHAIYRLLTLAQTERTSQREKTLGVLICGRFTLTSRNIFWKIKDMPSKQIYGQVLNGTLHLSSENDV